MDNPDKFKLAKAPDNQPNGPGPKPPPLQERRVGRFRIHQAMLGDLITARAVFREMVVMRAEANFVDNTLMVWADHPSFDVLESGTIVPEYGAKIHNPKGLKPKRHQDLVVVWRRLDVVELAAQEQS